MRLIDADTLIEKIKDYPYGYRGMIEADIAQMPTIAPVKWIPVSERLPEKYGEYLVSTSNGYVVSDYYASYGWDDDCDKDYAIAWMLLPEPWRGEEA